MNPYIAAMMGWAPPMDKPLRLGTLKCPACGTSFVFLRYGPIRLKDSDGCYSANCGKCKWNYQVKAPKK